jgi:membrane protein
VTVAGWIERARSFVREELWSEQERQSRPSLIGLLQFSIMVVQGFVRDHLLLRASALAYFTVLSVVPLLAVAVSIAGAVGVGSEGFVEQVVGTLAAVSPEAQTTIRGLIERANFGGLGTLSAAVLFLTTVLAIGQVEAAFNGIWGVTHSRPVSRRFSDYLAVLVVGPLLGGVTLSLSTTMKSQAAVQFLLDIPIFATFFDFGLSQAPVVVLTLVFGFLYWFLPNTRVRPLSALLGAVPAAVLTLVAQNLYVDFSVGVTRASAFFGTFSALALLFVWIYTVWAIVLFGAEIAFAHQTLHIYRRELRGGPAGSAEREAIGLRIVLEVARRFRDCAPPIDAGELSDTLRAPVRVVRDVVSRLCGSQILSQRTEETRRDLLQLGQPAEGIKVVDVLTSLRGERDPTGGDAALAATVESVISEIEENAVKSAAGRTVADLLEGIPPLADVDRKRASG